MPRTLLLTHFYPPLVGGLEAYLARVVSSLDPDRIVVLTDGSGGEVRAAGRPRVIRTPLYPWRWFRPSWLPWLWRLPRLLAREDIDTLWLGHYGPLGLAALLAARWRHTPLVVMTHGVDTLRVQAHWWGRAVLTFVLKRADVVVANSAYMAKRLQAVGVDEEQLVVVTPGIDQPPLVHVDRASLRRAWDLAPDQFVILTMGRLVERKGFDDVIRAVAELRTACPSALLLIAGAGPVRPRLEHLVNELGCQKAVRFLGVVEPRSTRKQELFAVADCFALTTYAREDGLDVESFGIVYLEALVAGLPIVASSVGGVQEIVRSGIEGSLVPPRHPRSAAHALEELWRDRAKREGMALNARKRAAAFSWKPRLELLRRLLDTGVTRPLVSVIVPAFNDAAVLGETLRSIVRQDYHPLEVIVVDDGSTDGTGAVVRAFPSVRLVHQSNAGAAAARNAGARVAQGTYLYFCDADVVLQRHAIASLVALLERHPECSFAYSAFRLGWRTFHRLTFNVERLRRFNYISTMSLVRREDFPGFDEQLTRFQDWDLWLTLVGQGKRGIGTRQYLFSARRRRGISTVGWRPRGDRAPEQALTAIQQKHHLV